MGATMIFVTLKSNIVLNKVSVDPADKNNSELIAKLKAGSPDADQILEVADDVQVEIGWSYDGSAFSKTQEMIDAEAAADAVKIVIQKRIDRLSLYDTAAMTDISEITPVLADLIDQALGRNS
jgi:hypothetical protein